MLFLTYLTYTNGSCSYLLALLKLDLQKSITDTGARALHNNKRYCSYGWEDRAVARDLQLHTMSTDVYISRGWHVLRI